MGNENSKSPPRENLNYAFNYVSHSPFPISQFPLATSTTATRFSWRRWKCNYDFNYSAWMQMEGAHRTRYLDAKHICESVYPRICVSVCLAVWVSASVGVACGIYW